MRVLSRLSQDFQTASRVVCSASGVSTGNKAKFRGPMGSPILMRPGSRSNKLGATVKATTRTETTIETNRVLIIHRRGRLLEG